MTLAELAARLPTKVTIDACKARNRSDKCSTRIMGNGFKLQGRWVCGYCARKWVIENEE